DDGPAEHRNRHRGARARRAHLSPEAVLARAARADAPPRGKARAARADEARSGARGAWRLDFAGRSRRPPREPEPRARLAHDGLPAARRQPIEEDGGLRVPDEDEGAF